MGIFDKFKKKDEKKVDVQSAKVSDANKSLTSQSERNKKVKAVKDDKPKASVAKEAKKETKKDPARSRGILVRPLITEKASDLSQYNKHVFEVSVSANKIQIAQAIEDRYGVLPTKINIINNRGRSVRYGRSTGTTRSWKKAVITLPEGKTIKIHEGV